jgi:hypothetical protein
VHPTDATNPFRRPLTLRDWYFCYGLPVKPGEYLGSEANGGFALVAGYRDWHEYEVVLDRVKAMLRAFAASGLHVVWGPQSWIFCNLLRRRNAVILFTHAAKATEAHDGKLEFRGELVPFRLIVGKVSPGFAGILDICACEADGIQEPLKLRAPACASKVADRKLTLEFWMAYYGEFLQRFIEAPTTYYDSIMQMRSASSAIG